MTTWLTSGVGLASGASVVAVLAVVATIALKSPQEAPSVPVVSTQQKNSTEPVEKQPETELPFIEQVAPSSTPNMPTGGQADTKPVVADQLLEVEELDAAVEMTQSTPKVAIQPLAQEVETPATTAMVQPQTEDTFTPDPVVDEPVLAASATMAATPEKAPAILTDISGPSFDLVRIEADGATVIAGTAEPGASVRIRFGDLTIETLTADNQGTFVALTDLPTSGGARPLVLETVSLSGQVVPSSESVLVLPFVAEAKAPPKIIMANSDGVTVLQAGVEGVPKAETTSAPVVALVDTSAPEPAIAPVQNYDLSLDTISYDKTGDVVLAGRGTSEQFVRVYVDNQPVEIETILGDGQWKVVLPEVKEGVYTLRVDAIDPQGAVTSRVESPFKRETPAIVAAAGKATLSSIITVQPGHTLWALAQEQYGDGVKYVQIFDANRKRIRNPNLIYPGQVFEVPD